MKTAEIISEWQKDCLIDYTNASKEALNVPYLHSKYWNILLDAKKQLITVQEEYDDLKSSYLQLIMYGIESENSQKHHWEIPDCGTVSKMNDALLFTNTDEVLKNKRLILRSCEERVEFLNDILKEIGRRSFLIKNAIDFMKLQNGVN